MWNMALRALRAGGVVGFDDNLLMPFRAGRIGLMAPQTLAEIEHFDLDVGVIGMSLAGPMAAFTRERLMPKLSQLLDLIRMAFFAGFFPRKYRLARRHFGQRFAPIPAILAKSLWRQDTAGHRIAADDGNR